MHTHIHTLQYICTQKDTHIHTQRYTDNTHTHTHTKKTHTHYTHINGKVNSQEAKLLQSTCSQDMEEDIET